jgi:hypothetical protein
MEEALVNGQEPLAARCGFTLTDSVSKRTTLLLLRLRHLLNSSRRNVDRLAEECVVIGFIGPPSAPVWLPPQEAQALLQTANPVGDISLGMKKEEITELLDRIHELQDDLEKFARQRSHSLLQSHQRVRKITKEGAVKVIPQLPMDLLGVYILQPGKGKS